jgi:putative hydrolase of the HAD superfamily
MTKLSAIIFDLDDTLYAERDYVLSGFGAVANWASANLGIDLQAGYDTLADLYHQGVRNNTFNQWLALHLELPPESETAAVTELLAIYRQHEPQIYAFPAAIELLPTLHTNYQLGLVSDGYLEVQQRKWQALGLDRYFEAVVFSDALGRENWKPSMEPFKLVLSKLGAEPTASVYIGDNPRKDFYGARQLGMKTIQIKRADAEYAYLEPPTADYRPDLTIESLDELLLALDRL